MISSKSLYLKVLDRLNKNGTNERLNLGIDTIVRTLRESELVLIKSKMNYNNIYKDGGLSDFKKRTDDLQVLLKVEELSPALTDKALNQYSAELPEDYMFYYRSYTVASNPCERSFGNRLIRRSNLDNILKDINYKPSFRWRNGVATISESQLEVYSDGSFEPTTVKLEYIKCPVQLDIEGYIEDGVNSSYVDSELPKHLEDELLDIAVEKLAMFTENSNQVINNNSLQQRNE